LLLYYITDRTQFPGGEASRTTLLLNKIAEAARCGIDHIQLRERDLPARDLECLAHEAANAVRSNSLRSSNGEPATRLLINSRADVALAVGADGVHLRADDITIPAARRIWAEAVPRPAGAENFPIVSISCHSDADVGRAAAEGADLAIFAPVFEKPGSPEIPAAGLEALRRACRYDIPVLALGGVTLETIPACLNCGAAGIAAIRLFQENNIGDLIARLRP